MQSMDSRSGLGSLCRSVQIFASLASGLVACVIAAPQVLPPAPPETNLPIASLAIAGPRIQFDSTLFDFGRIQAGGNAKHDFVFTNSGDGVLEIKEVRTSCGCTTAGEWSKRVEPGQTGKIPIEYRSKNDRGVITKSVTVIANAVDQPTSTLKIRAEIWRPIEMTPDMVLMRVVSGTATNQIATLRITNRTDAAVTLSDLQSNHKAVTGEITELQPGREFQLTVNVAPPFGPSNVYGKITIKSSSTNAPLLEVPVYAFVQPAIQVSPTVLSIPAVMPTNKIQRTVTIRSNVSSPLALSEPSLNADGVDLVLKEVQPGRYFTVSLTFPQQFEMSTNQLVELKVKSNYPDMPVIHVPLVKAVAASAAPRVAPRAARSPNSPPPPMPPMPPTPPIPPVRSNS